MPKTKRKIKEEEYRNMLAYIHTECWSTISIRKLVNTKCYLIL